MPKPHTTTFLIAGALAAAISAVPAQASLLTVSGSMSATASVSNPAGDGDEDNQGTTGLGFDNPGPRTLTVTSPEGTEDEQTIIQQTFSADTASFTASGSSDSADNLSGFETQGSMALNVVFTVDESELYAFSFTKDNDPGESITAQLTGSDSPSTPLFSFNNSNQGGAVTQLVEFTLNPGVTYTLNALFESAAGGNGSAQSTTTYLIGLETVPEPGTGLVVAIGLLALARRRMRSF
ncbi:PEP-CTERM sorting domain-containing protein [Algisphaera agarilytica]|uniref:Ice-binding protein C-terminal domain-containing protein n=1 Tax=Algisphaera agarilytica TaxID=1385975 RepID=A0A7X0H583_9BACT|nr:PEP-CTERM sorting domain-containing protein [Algisphaera agarilytica]MBB6429277.1 hypothetical protein [Algisphaera agarilytica]